MSASALRAPAEHGQILALPALDQVGALLKANRHHLNSLRISSLGKSLNELRTLARREVLASADAYLRGAGQTIDSEPDAPARYDGGSLAGASGSENGAWFVSGHQPELFHPGVWFKNFVLHRLAHAHGATALNLVIDTDTAKPAYLQAPADGRLARVPYDRTSAEMPYEERLVAEEATFADLPRQMARLTSAWPFEPMLPAFWREVMRHAERTPLLGERFAAGRRAIERRWGVAQREVPMSRVCQTSAFAWFACSILSRLPDFHAVYNQVVYEYRHAHGIRSRKHPVPDLTTDGEWQEAPFWAWRKGQGRRGRLFVRRAANAWDLRVNGEIWPSVPAQDLDRAVETWRALEAGGYKIRSRALTTTMFARLFLADVFIHGIGGGIYDALTDRILERFFALPAPGFLVLSATLLLPLPRYPDAAQRVRELDRHMRDMVYKPELFVNCGPAVEPLLKAKREWIARHGATHAERVARFHGIREINARLLASLLPQKEQAESELAVQNHRIQEDAVASRRDYAFCLYPEEMLRNFLTA